MGKTPSGGINLTKRNKFIKGTVILICANAIAKILGAVFKIPLTYLLREEGMAVYNTAFSVYVMMLSFATNGVPFALTKLLSEYTASGREYKIRPAARCAALILLALGLAASAAMYIFAKQFAYSMREPNAVGAIKAVSGAVVLVALGAVVKSSNEARSTLMPTALSQVTEAAFKLFAGFYLAAMLLKVSVYKAAEGAIFGVTAGEAFATLLLFSMWRFNIRKLPRGKMSASDARSIAAVAVPMMLCGFASGLLNMAEVSVIRDALGAIRFTPEGAAGFAEQYPGVSFTDALRLSADSVRKLYGAYSGYAQTIFNLPVGIIGTISAAATPLIADALASDSKRAVLNTAEKIMQPVLMLSLPGAAICTLYSSEILQLLFGNSYSAAMLSAIAPSMIFFCTANILLAVLHLSGRIFEPFCALCAALIIKIILSAVLIRLPNVNVLGIGISVCICSLLTLLLINMAFRRSFGSRVHVFRLMLSPTAASCVMIAVMRLISPAAAANFGQKASFLLCCAVGACGYFLSYKLFSR